MPVNLDLNEITETMELEECYEALIDSKFDPRDQESFISVAPLLKKLNNNKKFLPEILMNELKEHCHSQSTNNLYTSQVIMLKPTTKDTDFFMRANLWLGKDDQILKTSGEKSFFYNVPHDHNFSFLTSGYFGPGYTSDYYEYEYTDVVGYAGEEVELKFIERKNLEEGEVMLYRAYKDVHDQLYADSLSVSLNIMQATRFNHLKSQYIFDKQMKRIDSTTVTRDAGLEPMLEFAARLGGDNAKDILINFANSSVVDPDRFRAIKALANQHEDVHERVKFMESFGAASHSKLVRQLAKSYIKEQEQFIVGGVYA